jgi:hypothetical protein
MIIYRSIEDTTKTIRMSDLKKMYPNISFPKEVTNEQLEFLNIPYTAEEYVPPTPPEPTLEQIKAEKARAIQNRSNILMEQISDGYTDGEIKTFEQQNLGALDILNGTYNSENAMFVIALLKNRLAKADVTNEEIVAFANKIRTNYTNASAYTSLVVGTQQHLELLVREAETKEEVEAIDAYFTPVVPDVPAAEPEEDEDEIVEETDPEDTNKGPTE